MISDLEASVKGLVCEGFRYGYEIEKGDATEALEAYLGSLEERRAHYEGRLEGIEKSDWLFQIIALCSRPPALLDAVQEWTEGFIGDLRERHGSKKRGVNPQ